MPPLSLTDVQDAIKRMEATWKAGLTTVTPQVLEGDTRLFGLNVREDDRRRMFAAALAEEPLEIPLAATAPLPPSVDWRNRGGNNWVSPIQDQGSCASCVAFATCAVIESRVRISEKNPSLSLDLSEAHLFFCGVGNGCKAGWEFDPALARCRNPGVGLESAFGYAPYQQQCLQVQPVAFVTDWEYRVKTSSRKQAISQNGPVIAGMRVYEDFAYYKEGVYQHVAGTFKALHAVAVVGYDDNEQCWIVKNSWGTGWGEHGFLRIGYGECGLDTKFPFFDPEVSYAP